MTGIPTIRKNLSAAAEKTPHVKPLAALLDIQLRNYANEDEAGKAALKPKIARNIRDIERAL